MEVIMNTTKLNYGMLLLWSLECIQNRAVTLVQVIKIMFWKSKSLKVLLDDCRHNSMK